MGVAHQSLQLQRALAESAPERAREKVAVAEETTKSALNQTRNLAIELRRSVAEESFSKRPCPMAKTPTSPSRATNRWLPTTSECKST